MREFSQGYFLESCQVNWYHPKDMDGTEPEILPLYIKDFEKMPSTIVLTAGFDPLRDESLLFAQNLMGKGVDTHHY